MKHTTTQLRRIEHGYGIWPNTKVLVLKECDIGRLRSKYESVSQHIIVDIDFELLLLHILDALVHIQRSLKMSTLGV